MDYFAPNLSVMTARWPTIAETIRKAATNAPLVWRTGTPEKTLIFSGIHLTSAFDRRREAALQATLIPDESEIATVYGMALGDLQRVLCQRSALSRIRVVVMNPSIAASCLAAVLQTDWLLDDRISLHLGAEESDVQLPFAPAPAMLRLASDDSLALRDRIAQALAKPFHTLHFQQLRQILDARLEENRTRVSKDGDVASLFDTSPGGRAVVIAAGPTAAAQFEWLCEERTALSVIVVSTALRPLLSAGIVPDAVLVIDPKEEIRDHFRDIDTSLLRDVPLVYLPTVHPDVITAWTGPRLAMYIRRERFEQVASEMPRGFLHCDGTVTHAAVDLAVKMGAKEVVLVGTDFSFPDHSTHMVGAAHRTKLPSETLGSAPEVINGFGKRNPSRPDMVDFLRSMEQYIAQHSEVTFFNTGRAGAHIAGTVWLEKGG